MSTFLPIIVVLAVLFSFFVAYLSFKTWRIFQVILVVLILLATLPFYYLAARTLKTHQEWRLLVKEQQAQLDQMNSETHDLQEGNTKKDPQLVGIREMKVQLHEILRDRGEVWRGVAPDKVDDKGLVEFSVKEPDPHGIVAKMVLFVFEETPGDKPGRFLGEFKVGEVADKTVKMDPNLPLDEAGLTLLQQSKGPWSLYATLPVDDAKLLASLSADERARLLPADSATAFADKERSLRDYGFLFWEKHKEQVILDDAIAKLKEHIQSIDTETKHVQDEIKYRDTEKANLKADLVQFNAEKKLVADYFVSLDQQYKALHEQLTTIFRGNNQMAAQIAAMQLKAAEIINVRIADQVKAELARPAEP